MSFRVVGLSILCFLPPLVVACVGDEPSSIENDDDSGAVDEGGALGDSGGRGDAAATDSAPLTEGGPVEDGGPSTACSNYCAVFGAQCSFSTTTTDSFPSEKACLEMCGTMPPTGDTADSITCRAKFIADGGDCPAGGPFAADNSTSSYCGNDEPCTALCRALSPRCDGAGASVGDCKATCTGAAEKGNPGIACVEQATLSAYGSDNPADISSYCEAFTACAN